MVTYHYLDALIAYYLMTGAMLSGVLLILPKVKGKIRRALVILHIVLSVGAYIALTITMYRAPAL